MDLKTEGEIYFGSATKVYSPTVVELFGRLGLDFVFVDLEHAGFSPWDSEPLSNLSRAADASGTELLVRIPSDDAMNHQPLIRKVTGCGVNNLLIPRVSTAEEIRKAVKAAYYWFGDEVGDRGVGSTRATHWGEDFGEADMRAADKKTNIGVMIETESAVKELDEILGVEGLGFAFIGPADLSHSLGRPMAMDDPEIKGVIGEIEQKCRSHGVPLAGAFGYDKSTIAEYIETGYGLLLVGSDLGAIKAEVESLLDEFVE